MDKTELPESYRQRKKEEKRKTWKEVAWGLTMFSQIGISVALPLIVFIFGSVWLKGKFSLGSWIIVVGIILGIGTSVDCAIQVYRQVMHHMKQNETNESGESDESSESSQG